MLTAHKYISVDDTVNKIYKMIAEQFADSRLSVFDGWNLNRIFDYVSKKVKYVEDPENVATQGNDTVELLKAPYITDLNGGDCDDKSILLGAIFTRKKIPYRLKVITTDIGKDYHHIYPEIFYNNFWVPFDATYPTGIIFKEKIYAKAKVYWLANGLVYSKELPSNAGAMLNGKFNGLNGGTRLITLTGNSSVNKNGVMLSDIYLPNEIAQIRGGVNPKTLGSLGFDPATIAATALTIIGAIFGGGGPIPPDNRTMLQILNQKIDQVYTTYGNIFGSDQAMDEISGYRAMKAAGLAKWGLIPPGKAIHDIWPSIPWSQVENEISQKAAAFYPFLRWIAEQDRKTGLYKGYDSDAMLLKYYNDNLSKSGPVYSAFAAVIASLQKPGLNTAGLGGSLPIIILIGAAIYLFATKKKSR